MNKKNFCTAVNKVVFTVNKSGSFKESKAICALIPKACTRRYQSESTPVDNNKIYMHILKYTGVVFNECIYDVYVSSKGNLFGVLNN